MNKVSFSVLFLVLFFGNGEVFGQEKSGINDKQFATTQAFSQIRKLKEGVLIIRLPSMHRQRDHYTSQISLHGDESLTRTYTKKLRELVAHRDSFNKALMYGINQEYRFSKHRYIYDEDYSKTDTSHNNQYFLNDQLSPDPSLTIGNAPFLVLSKLHYTPESGTSREVLRITTADLVILDSPFPQLQNDRGLTLAIDYPVVLNKSHRKAATKIIRRLNKKLVNFYLKYEG